MVDISEEDLVAREFAANNVDALDAGDAGVASGYHGASFVGDIFAVGEVYTIRDVRSGNKSRDVPESTHI
jgi:hypothetical protein